MAAGAATTAAAAAATCLSGARLFVSQQCNAESSRLRRSPSPVSAAVNGNSSAVVHSSSSSSSSSSKVQHLFKYPDGPCEATFFKFDNVEEVSSALAEYIVQRCNEAVKQHGSFTIALSGGSVVKALSLLSEGPYLYSVPWDKWHVFWVDERLVPLTHEDSNYKLAHDEVLSKVPIPPEQIYAIQNFKDETAAATAYESKLRELMKKKVVPARSKKFPCLDFILLGIGPDGHIASLFPNRATLAEEKRWVIPVSNSPKPPPKRITMTLPCINHAENVVFVVLGSSKAHVLQTVLERPALPGALPAQMVRLEEGKLVWFVDQQAASSLSIENWNNAKSFPFFDFQANKRTAKA